MMAALVIHSNTERTMDMDILQAAPDIRRAITLQTVAACLLPAADDIYDDGHYAISIAPKNTIYYYLILIIIKKKYE